MPAGSIPISEETALTQDKYLQEPQQSRRQGAKCESINSVQQSSSSGTQINEDFIKDEYDYLRFTHEYYEYEQVQKNIIVRGRLKKHLPFWRSIGSSDFVLDTIEHGYKIPLFSQPCKTYCKNNKSALLEPEFVSEAITDLLDRALIEKCKDAPYVVNPLTVSAHSSGKKRLILDLRVVNKHLWKQSVKYEDIKIALAYLQQGFHMIRFDLTSAYHFIDLYYPHTDFMGFSWVDKEGNVVFYKFLVLPFGLSSACYVFSKICRPLVAKWRGEGKLVTMFLDDGFGCAQDFHKAENLSQEIKNDILRSGFVPNATKSVWIPVQILEFLGVILDSLHGTLFIPDRRISKAKNSVSEILLSVKKHRKVHVKRVASIVGQIISMSIVLGRISQIMSRYLSLDILNANSWESYIQLSEESCKQLLFWKDNLSVLNTKDIFESHKCTKIVYSDASSTGFAGYEVSTINGISHGMWSEEESLKSSTWRELVAVYRVLLSLSHFLANQRVKWFTDNQGVKSIANKGSMNRDLQDISYKIFNLCMSRSISLEMEWIPRSENEKSDYLSRIIDFDDWGISFNILSIIQSRFGNLHVDWFASEHNAKLPKFYSRFWNPSCRGVDAFAEFWGDQFGLFVPPISVVYRVVKKLITDKACGVLVVPCWRSAVFWPFLCPNGTFINEIVDWFDLPTDKQHYVKCKSGKGIFGNIDLHFRMLALKVDFRNVTAVPGYL